MWAYSHKNQYIFYDKFLFIYYVQIILVHFSENGTQIYAFIVFKCRNIILVEFNKIDYTKSKLSK